MCQPSGVIEVPAVVRRKALAADAEQWLADLGATDGVYPSQVGYGLISWLFLHLGWHEWFGSVEA